MALIGYRSNAQKRWRVQERVIVILIANIFIRVHCLLNFNFLSLTYKESVILSAVIPAHDLAK